MTIQNKAGQEITASYGHPLWDKLDNTRVRFVKTVGAFVVVMDNNTGKILPDYRHHSQVIAY